MSFYYNIASGSKGNAALVADEHTCVLIDAGTSARKIVSAMREIGLGAGDITALLITHEHTDHIAALEVLAKKADFPIYASGGTAFAVLKKLPHLYERLHALDCGVAFRAGNFTVTAYPTPHDAMESTAYIIDTGSGTLGCATDLGYMPASLLSRLKGLDLVVLEANHDETMLKNGPYPYPLKQRILGTRGHLSNAGCACAAVELAESGTGGLVLAHLSEENNLPELALRTVEDMLAVLDGHTMRVALASQERPTGPIALRSMERGVRCARNEEKCR